MMLAEKIRPFLKNLKGAIHVGANIGEERSWYNYNGFTKVLWFEPNRDIFLELKKNLKQVPNQKAVNIGIHDYLRKANLHIANNRGQSSSLLDLGLHAQYHPDVKYIEDQEIKLIRLDDFLKDGDEDVKDYNFLNIDVQGTELNVLLSMGDLLKKMNYVYVEVNIQEVYKDCALLPEIDNYLSTFNFVRIMTKMTKAYWGDAFYIKDGYV